MEENEIIEETMDDFETNEDDFETNEEGGSLLAQIVVAGVMGIICVGAGYALSKKDDIAAALANKKEARRQKEVQQLLDRLSKLQQEKPVKEDETEK